MRDLVMIVCQLAGHMHPAGSYDGIPWTYEHEAERDGWQLTTHKMFSQDGRPVWICPECAMSLKRLEEGYFFAWHHMSDYIPWRVSQNPLGEEIRIVDPLGDRSQWRRD